MALVLRIPKGSALTNKELDDNFTYLESKSNNLVNALNALSGQSINDIIDTAPDMGVIPHLEESLRFLIDTKQDLNYNLTSLSELESNGVLIKTGTGTLTTRFIQGESGVVITNADGIAGNPSISLNREFVATLDDPQTFTKKTIDGRVNTIRNIDINRDTVGTVPIVRGGTGSSNATDARTSLNALASPSDFGIVVKSSNTASVSRSIEVAGTGLSIINATGTGGNPTIVLSSDTGLAPNTLVLRDSTGSFKANTVVAYLDGIANRAVKLSTARRINNVLFDGTADITIFDNTKLPVTGGTMTGYLNLSGDPTLNLHAATKRYVDNSLSTYVPVDNTKLPLSGGVMNGFITLHSQPALSMHAATKQFVESKIAEAVSVFNNSRVPVGTILTVVRGLNDVNFPPTGYLLCNGQYVSTTTYANLYAVIGNSYGPPQTGTFRLPGYPYSNNYYGYYWYWGWGGWWWYSGYYDYWNHPEGHPVMCIKY